MSEVTFSLGSLGPFRGELSEDGHGNEYHRIIFEKPPEVNSSIDAGPIKVTFSDGTTIMGQVRLMRLENPATIDFMPD